MMKTNTGVNFSSITCRQDYKTVLLFDLALGGHHPSYIKRLVEYWCEQETLGKLYIVVSPQFLTIHNDVTNIAAKYSCKNVQFLPITQDEYSNWKNQKNSIVKIFREWHLFSKYSESLGSNDSLLLYFDHFQLPLFFGL